MSTKLVKRATPVGELKVIEGRMVRGHAELVQRKVALKKDHYSEMSIAGKTRYMLSPEGFDFLNEICGLEFTEIRGAGLSGEDADAQGFTRQTVTMTVKGYTLTGAVHCLTGSVTYSPADYFRRDLADLALVKQWKTSKNGKRYPEVDAEATAAAPVCFGNRADKPTRPGRWEFWPIDGDAGLWADMDNGDVIGKYQDYLHARTFALRKAQGILRRNLGCRHPGGPSKYLEAENGQVWGIARAWVPVYGDLPMPAMDLAKAIATSSDPDKTIRDLLPEAETETVSVETEGEFDGPDEDEGRPLTAEDLVSEEDNWFGQDK